MDTLTLELDLVDTDNDGLAGLRARSAAGGVQLTVLNPCGPGGGNPVCQLSGGRYALLGWLLTNYTQDVDDIQYVMGDAKPAA